MFFIVTEGFLKKSSSVEVCVCGHLLSLNTGPTCVFLECVSAAEPRKRRRTGAMSENMLWWALKVLASKWSLWTDPVWTVWMLNQRKACKKKKYIARNRPGIEDKHMQATGRCQYLLSFEYNGSLIRTMITLEQLSLSLLTAESPHSYHFN